MDKKQAAAFLNISTRALERYMSLQRIGVRYERGKTGDVAIFDEGELRRFKDQLSGPSRVRPAIIHEASPSSETESRTLARLSDVAPLAMLERMTAALDALKPNGNHAPAVPIADKMILRLTEAAALTTLSRGHLRAAITEGKLKARIIGRGWRVKRADLEEYVREL